MHNDIKIAFVVPYLSTGGAERALINIAVSFFKNNINVQIVAATTGNASYELPKDLKVFKFQNEKPLDSPSFYRNTKALLKYIQAEKPDVIISTSDYLNIALVFARYLSNKKFKLIVSQQVHVSSYLKRLPWLNRQFIKLIQKIIAVNADLIIGASKGVVKDFSNRYNLNNHPTQIQTIYNPVYEEKIILFAKEKIEDSSFTLSGTKLITVGRLVKQKEHATLFKAFKLVLHTMPNTHLYIIGIGVEEENLKKLSIKLNISDKITFLGYKENSYAYVAKCDVFILSSEYEGFGNVIVEALATGTNVVSTDCPSGPAEILNNGEFGFLCPVGNAVAMSDQIIKAIKNKIPATTLHERATYFSTDLIAKQYMDAVAGLLNR